MPIDRREELMYRLSERLHIQPELAYKLVRRIQAQWPQVNDKTVPVYVSSPHQRVDIPEMDMPRRMLKERRVRKSGYRWQFHQAFYEMMDLLTYVERGWTTERYEDWSDMRPPQERELNFQHVGINLSFGSTPYLPDAGIADVFFAYFPERDQLFICARRVR